MLGRARRLIGGLRSSRGQSVVALLLVVAVVLWAHLGSGQRVFTAAGSTEPGWEAFKRQMNVSEFGDDGYFVRAVQHGFNLFFYTDRYAWRFTRRGPDDPNNHCGSCHRVEEMAYALVNGDREEAASGRRVSFEQRVMRCYVGRMDGFVPTIYDPAVRDIRILARMVARHLNLAEGALPDEV